jgi:GNAT superfamily N-acetyltransferase
MIEPLQVGDQATKVGWSVDTYVLPEYRGCGLGRELQRLNQNSHGVFMSLSMSDANRRIKNTLGATALQPVSVFKLRLRTTPQDITRRIGRRHRTLGTAGRYSGLAYMASTMVRGTRAWTWTRASASSRKLLHALEFVAVERFPDDMNGLWRSMAGQFGIAVERTARLLNWKFCDQPQAAYQRFAVRRNGRLCAYLILRRCCPPEPDYGLLVDLLAPPADSDLARALIVFAVEQFAERGVFTVKAAASLSAHAHAYRSLGFQEVRHLIPMCHVSPELRSTLTEPTLSAADSPRSAFFTYGDHDLDQYPLTKP